MSMTKSSVTIGEVIATGLGGILAALLFARDR